MCWLRFSESPLAPKFNLKKNFPPQEAHSYLTKPTPPAPRGRETVECTQTHDGEAHGGRHAGPVSTHFATVQTILAKGPFSLKATGCRRGNRAKPHRVEEGAGQDHEGSGGPGDRPV